MIIRKCHNQNFGMKIANTEGLRTVLNHWSSESHLGKRAIGELGKIKKMMNDSFKLEIRDVEPGYVGRKPVEYVIKYKDGTQFDGKSNCLNSHQFIKDLKMKIKEIKAAMVELKGEKSILNRK